MLPYLTRALAAALCCGAVASVCHAQQTIAIEFTQDNCRYCRQLEKFLDPLAAEGFAIRKVDVGAPAGAVPGSAKSGRELAAVYGVTQTPTIILQTFGSDGKPDPASVRRFDHADPVTLRQRLLAAGVHYLPPAPRSN